MSRWMIVALMLALAGCSRAERAAESAPSASGAAAKGVRVVIETTAVDVSAWLAMQRSMQFTCFLTQKGRKPETIADDELVAWEQIQRLYTFREERLYTKDAFLLDKTSQHGELDMATCRWVEGPPKRELYIARGCSAVRIDFDDRTAREEPVATPECLAATYRDAVPRKPEHFIDRQGERRLVAGQACLMPKDFSPGSRSCVLEAMPIHPLSADALVVAYEADPQLIESARQARARPINREMSAAIGAGFQIPSGLQGQASVVEVGVAIPPERFVVPPEARSFKQEGKQ